MTRKAGLNWVIWLFGLQCVLRLVPLAIAPRAGLWSLVSLIGLVCAVAAGRRAFWGWAGVLVVCALSVAVDLFAAATSEGADPILVLHALLYIAIAGALFSARREFRRRSPERRFTVTPR